MHYLKRSACTFLLILDLGRAAAKESVVIEIAAGGHNRDRTPIIVALPQAMRKAEALSLVRLDTNTAVPVQILAGKVPQAVWILRETLAAGATRQYRLDTAETVRDSKPTTTCDDSGQELCLRVGRKPVLKYQYAMKEPPAGLDPVYRRSGYIHPVFTPAGRIITDDFPPDEPHQHGIFFAWVNTTIAERPVNFWDPKAQTGQVRHSAIERVSQGDVFAEFQVQLLHSDISNPEATQPVLEETWTVRAYHLDRQFLVDFESVQQCVADSCTVNQHHYGGMAFRGLRKWFDDKSVALVTSDGKDQQTGNESRPHWVRLSGPVENSRASLIAMGHPANFRADQPVRLHPDKPYFCFAPMILGSFKIDKQQTFISRYRLLIDDDEKHSDRYRPFWNDYAEPPVVRIRKSD